MYLIEQEIANEIAKHGFIRARAIRKIFEAKTEKEAEMLEELMREEVTQRTGDSEIGRAVTVFSPLFWAHSAITSYIQKTGNQSLRMIAPEVLSAEEAALLAQRDIMLSDEAVEIVIKEIERQGYEFFQWPREDEDSVRIFSYADLKRSTQKIRDKKNQDEFSELRKSLLKEFGNKEDLPSVYIDQIKRIANQKGISQQVIADKTGFKRANVTRILSGRYMPRLDNFIKLCSAVGIKVILEDQKNE